jgi:hypothetical protein
MFFFVFLFFSYRKRFEGAAGVAQTFLRKIYTPTWDVMRLHYSVKIKLVAEAHAGPIGPKADGWAH